MALYIPASRQRRRTVLVALATLLAGLVIGTLVGRATTTTVAERTRTVQAHARALAAGLRVIVLHDQAGLATAENDGGTALVLQETRVGLLRLFDEAPWLPAPTRDGLVAQLDALQRTAVPATPASGQAADALATAIEAAAG